MRKHETTILDRKEKRASLASASVETFHVLSIKPVPGRFREHSVRKARRRTDVGVELDLIVQVIGRQLRVEVKIVNQEALAAVGHGDQQSRNRQRK